MGSILCFNTAKKRFPVNSTPVSFWQALFNDLLSSHQLYVYFVKVLTFVWLLYHGLTQPLLFSELPQPESNTMTKSSEDCLSTTALYSLKRWTTPKPLNAQRIYFSSSTNPSCRSHILSTATKYDNKYLMMWCPSFPLHHLPTVYFIVRNGLAKLFYRSFNCGTGNLSV